MCIRDRAPTKLPFKRLKDTIIAIDEFGITPATSIWGKIVDCIIKLAITIETITNSFIEPYPFTPFR